MSQKDFTYITQFLSETCYNTIVSCSKNFLKHIHLRHDKRARITFHWNRGSIQTNCCETSKLPQGNIFVIQILRTHKYRRLPMNADGGRSIGLSSRASESESRATLGGGDAVRWGAQGCEPAAPALDMPNNALSNK